MKLSELAQRYLKHQPARLAATIRQQQRTIKELEYQKESLVNSLHQQQEINAMVKEELKTVSRLYSPSIQMKDDDEQIHFYILACHHM